MKSTAVRNYANGLAYKNPALATDDAMRIGRLHTFLPGQLLVDSVLSTTPILMTLAATDTLYWRTDIASVTVTVTCAVVTAVL